MLFLHRQIKLDTLKEQGYTTLSSTSFTFPDTLGALFFGASLVVFYMTIKRIAQSELPTARKIWAYLAVDLLFILGVLAHVLDITELSLYTSTYTWPPTAPADTLLLTVTGNHGHFIERLQGFILIFTGWVAAYVLALRAYLLTGRVRWFGIVLATLCGATFLVQIILYGTGFKSAWPSHPIANLVLQIPITIAVVRHAYTSISQSEKNAFCIFEDTLIDAGALLTVGLLLQTIFPFAGVTFEPVNALLPHLQNIAACTVFSQLIARQDVGGVLKLVSDESLDKVTVAPVSA